MPQKDEHFEYNLRLVFGHLTRQNLVEIQPLIRAKNRRIDSKMKNRIDSKILESAHPEGKDRPLFLKKNFEGFS